ncbi:hypothetical protein F5Y14DRAFT_129187 [Nemania sp. NC0429]|nr:hypothetical protein F5Y14DRAFT_129187 [Nemania sp. NC0429]
MPAPKSKAPSNGAVQDRKYFQLWRRFYEPLVILKILGNTRGEHSPPLRESPVHRFLDNLAYLCDHDKGGSTTSAVGLEDAPDRFNFWVASNDPKQSAKSALFLSFVLHDVRTIADAPDAGKAALQGKLVRRCLEFAKPRVKKEARLLSREIIRCARFFSSSKDAELSKWLGRFREKEPDELCHLAYRERDAAMMKRLSSYIQPSGGDPSAIDGQQSAAVKDLVHRLGRLAHHIRAPQQLIEDASRHTGLRNALDEFKVVSVRPRQPAAERPPAEPDIHIHSIVNRMLPRGLDDRHREAADAMNRRFDIVARFRQEYDNGNFRPLVHAEIQVLEHFWAGKRRFFDDGDRYIGCSKPACYCCHLYMRHHPARCVVPQTSRNVYINWGLEALPQGTRDADYKHQRDILNEMVKTIRGDALDQILRKTAAAPWHPDSQTGFTLRAPSAYDNNDNGARPPGSGAMRMVDLGECCRRPRPPPRPRPSPSPSRSSMSGLHLHLHPHSRAAGADRGLNVADMTTDTDEDEDEDEEEEDEDDDDDSGSAAGGDCDASGSGSGSGSRHSSWASISDASTRGPRDLAWMDDGDSDDSDSDSDSGGAKL